MRPGLRTDVGWKCRRPSEREEEDVRHTVDDVSSIQLGQRANKHRSISQAKDIERDAEDSNFMYCVKVARKTFFSECGLVVCNLSEQVT